jgi:hypothetical protein
VGAIVRHEADEHFVREADLPRVHDMAVEILFQLIGGAEATAA